MDTKLRIDLGQGTIEAEGSESFVRAVYDDFKDALLTRKTPSKQQRQKESPKPPPKTTTPTERRPRTGKQSYTPVKDLDLKARDGRPGLRNFYEQYAAKNNFERNALFVHYLHHIAEVEQITVAHVFTCYKEVSRKVPGALMQSLKDTASRKGWINTSALDNITTTTAGENAVEYGDIAKVEQSE